MNKRGLILSLTAALVLSLSAAALAFGPGIIGHMGGGWGGGPGMQGGMMGSGGSGMMGQGYSQGFQGHPCLEAGAFSSTTELTKEKVSTLAATYLARMGNPNLKVGEVIEKEGAFEVTIVTKDNSLVEQYTVDKKTGTARPTE